MREETVEKIGVKEQRVKDYIYCSVFGSNNHSAKHQIQE